MIKPVALTLILSFAAVSNAAPVPNPTPAPTPVPGEFDISTKCPELSLVAGQKEQLKTVFEQTKQKLMAQRQALIDSKKALVSSLADVNATQEIVVGHQNTVKSNVGAILDTIFSSVNQITFTVLQKEQRPHAVACFQKVRKEWRQKWLEKKCATRTTPTEESEDIDVELGEM